MRPCPFCSKEVNPDALAWGVHYNDRLDEWVFNHHCHKFSEELEITITVYGKTKEEVIERWDSRAEEQTGESV